MTSRLTIKEMTMGKHILFGVAIVIVLSSMGGGHGVIHIGFLSSTKILSLNRNIYASAEWALRSGSVGQCFAARHSSHEPLRASGSALPLRVLSGFIRRVPLTPGGSFAQSSIRIQAGRHRPWDPRSPAPSRPRRDQNNVSTVPCSLVVHPAGRTLQA